MCENKCLHNVDVNELAGCVWHQKGKLLSEKKQGRVGVLRVRVVKLICHIEVTPMVGVVLPVLVVAS